MKEFILTFLWMGGYAAYVFPAYGIVCFLLFIQWLIPIRRWKNYLTKNHE